ncbi:PAP2-domain-containing protein [Ascodesmis nigricans]|uniref:PAP2-domain-containing protein n=1 Tax=Ascodesmis nigricans TaxID=341454 RepID=A0A4S2N1H5_9PEZI|nr:PAP2-domain-containing protein [Ascodesmis nigricans]
MSPPPPSADFTTDSPNLASLSLTHISYDPTDPISIISAYLSLLPLFLMTAIITTVFTTRKVESLLFILGQFANEFLNNILKRLFRSPRPTTLRGGYGMPSSHSQFVWFFVTYLVLMMAARNVGAGKALKGWGMTVYGVLAVVAAAGVAGSRVYLGYHTLNQVLVGV